MIKRKRENVCPTCRGTGVVMRQQISSHPARKTDPQTSHDAADKFTTTDVGRFSASSIQARMLWQYYRRNMTAHEAAERYVGLGDPLYETCRRRVGDLLKAGYLETTGESRTNTGRSSPAGVLRITADGRLALRRLEDDGWSR